MNSGSPQGYWPLPSCSRCPVRCFALFEPLNGHEADAAGRQRVGFLSIPSKQHLYRRGDMENPTVTLCSGWAMLYRILRDGRRQIIRIALPGDLLAFRPNTSNPMDHSAVAITDAQVCAFADTETLCKDFPPLAWQLAKMNARTSHLLDNYLAVVAHRSARERIAFMLLELYQRLEVRRLAAHGRGFCPLTQEDIGDILGLTAVHVNRILQGLRREGIVQLRQRELQILNFNRLRELGSPGDHSQLPELALT